MMSTTKTFTNIKAGKRHQIDATARGYYDFRTTVVPQPNKPLSYNMKVYDGLKYDVDLSKNSVRPGEINFDGTVLPYVENNALTKTNYCFGNSGTNYAVPVYEEVYDNITKVGDVSINNGIASNFSPSNYLSFPRNKFTGNETIIIKFKLNNTNDQCIWHAELYTNLQMTENKLFVYNWNTNVNQFILDVVETNKWYWCKYVITNTNDRTVYLSTDGINYEEKLTWTDNNARLSYGNYDYLLLGTSSYNTSVYMYGMIDLSESSITINENTILFNDGSLSPKLTNYNLVGNAKINGSICSGFDSSSRITLPNTISSTEKPMIVKFKTGSNISSYQKIIEKDDDGISFQITGGKIQYWIKETSSWNDFADVETNTNYELKVTVTSDTTYTINFKKESDAEYTSVNVSDASFTVGEDLLYIVGNSNENFNKPFLGTIDISGVPGLIYATESKTGIFKDYIDNGKAKTLNCFSNSNNYTVLTPNEDIESEDIKYTYLGTVDIPKHNIYNVDNFYGWSNNSKSIFTKTLQLSTDIPLYNSSYKQQSTIINGTFTTTPAEENGIVSSFNGGILKLTFTDPSTEIRFYSKVNPSDQNHERQIMGVEGTSNNIGRDNNVWRLWNGSGHYGSAFDINTDYWVCLVDNRSGTYTMYVLKDNNYTKDTLPEITSWNKEFEFSGSFFKSTNCVIGGGISNGSIIENWTGTIDLNNTWFESGNSKLWEGTSELKIGSFTDNSITLTNNEVYTRNSILDKHFVLPNSTSGEAK